MPILQTDKKTHRGSLTRPEPRGQEKVALEGSQKKPFHLPHCLPHTQCPLNPHGGGQKDPRAPAAWAAAICKVKSEQLRRARGRPSGLVASRESQRQPRPGCPLSSEEGIRMKESSGKCPVTFLRENNGAFRERPYFSGGFRWVPQRRGIVNRNQAKMSKKELTLAAQAALAKIPKS